MPEIWLNYGITDVVLDIRAENLEQKIDSDGKIMEDSAINEKLNGIDLTKPMEAGGFTQFKIYSKNHFIVIYDM